MITPDEARKLGATSGASNKVCKALFDLAQQVDALQEKVKLSDEFREEVERCYGLANSLDEMNPTLKGSFTGAPSERISRQVEALQADAARKHDVLKMVRDYIVTMKGRGHEYQIAIDKAMK